jgi:hypothetical protein
MPRSAPCGIDQSGFRLVAHLQSLKFRGGAFASSIVGLQARELRELSGDCCGHLSDATLSMVVARHGNLESLQLGSDCERVTSDALKVVAFCCPKLRRLCISGIREVDKHAIQALFQHCKGLTELGFLDSHTIDEGVFGTATSLRFLFVSVAGCRCIVWSIAAHSWSKLPNLAGLDVSCIWGHTPRHGEAGARACEKVTCDY